MKLHPPSWFETSYPISETFNWDMVNDASYREKYRNALICVFSLMKNVKNWWFLHYGDRILIRFKHKSSNKLNYPSTRYYEESSKWKSLDELMIFIEMMQSCRKLVEMRLHNSNSSDVGRFSERAFHCIWNSIHGIGQERLFHSKLLEHGDILSELDTSIFKSVYDE